ncbi:MULTISPECIES: nuclease-related domain-containing protein [Moraxella]|uniref:NERD domain-containing protein n=2 Tax=Moraxella lacunata TaxID=477 RepID=A0A1B8PX65_MORLA|nr:MULTISPECIES: nuclease-related domain-containing protein [Moraxella]MBE9578902.1 NERD domain-containing protein [Moraxella sp. K1664]MBE9588246.1 NERD domain-containing protein [Moraxella sp. K1630]MBE9596380.1 NERD domain-containing protein [Moraxella sp. K2450]MDH9218752.1 nuclease-related domain-containing protein [Moraxella lacunata]MDI4482866.1 NERD domain-containing protein [Moraxella lacunata]
MKMIPPMLYHTESKAEQTVFNHLKQSFVDKDQYVVMHSVKLHHHPKKRFGEIDFLLCTNYGLFVLEIKGGRVSCQNGIWYYQDKTGHTNTGGSPFHQADTAMQALRQSLLVKFDKAWVDKICFGYGVILTDSRLPNHVIETLECEKPMICHGGEHQSLQKWLLAFFNYWQKRNKKIMPMVDRMSDKMLSDIVQYIRPNFVSCDDVDEDKKEQNINNDFYITTSNIQEKNHEIKQNATDQPIINRQSLQNASMDEFLNQCLVDFYEKKVGDDYILAKDITIITDDKKKCDEIKSTLKNKGVLIKESDSYSFKRRRADEMTLMTMQDLPVIHNKILIAVIKKDNQEKQQTLIEQNATHIAQLFYY